MKKKTVNLILTIVAATVVCMGLFTGVAYGVVVLGKLPIDLPFYESDHIVAMESEESKEIVEDWRNAIWYVRSGEKSVQDVIKEAETDVITADELKSNLPYIDHTTLEAYITGHPEVIENGYEKLFIDEADYMNTPTGIKTIYGDDVLAVDSYNGIVIVGIDVPFSSGVSKVKLAIVSNSNQVDVNLVKDLSYWESIADHASETGAILGINASSYTWNPRGTYATLYGAAKYHGTLYRKMVGTDDLIGFSEDGVMSLGGSIDSAYNAFEYNVKLINNSESLVGTNNIVLAEGQEAPPESTTNQDRYAQSAIGQNGDGTTFLVVASGGMYGSNLGITNTELADIFLKYKVENAVTLSGGSRSIMYWNGRNINETVGYKEEGVRLPNAVVVLPNTGENSSIITKDGIEKKVEEGTEVKDENVTDNPDTSEPSTTDNQE